MSLIVHVTTITDDDPPRQSIALPRLAYTRLSRNP
jgi:hypothetical protein